MQNATRIGGGITLRPHQKKVMRAFDNGKRWIVLRWSRRAGKSLFAWNLLIREAINRPGVYWYAFNNYNTAYNDIWLAMTSKGVKFLDMIPENMVARKNVAKLEIELTNGSVIKLIGIDKADKLVGAGLNGVVFDEYAVLNPASIEFITAMLGETGGWRMMISTPRGKNHFYEQYQFAKNNPDFAFAMTVHAGMPEIGKYMAKGFLEQERAQIISKYGNDALYQQEYHVSWVTPNSGSVFGELVKMLKDDGRYCHIEGDDGLPYYTAWDLGNADNTSIVLFQVDHNGSPAVIDHIENRAQEVSWYVEQMKERGWNVQMHFLPHDAAYRKGARNETYKQVLGMYNIRNTTVLNKPNRVEDKLNYLRRVFSGMTINEGLDRVIECLEKLEYEWNEKNHLWSDKPTHKGGYSDTVDSLCYMGQAIGKYRISASRPFTQARVAKQDAVVDTKEARLERFNKLVESEFKPPKKKATSSLSMFM